LARRRARLPVDTHGCQPPSLRRTRERSFGGVGFLVERSVAATSTHVSVRDPPAAGTRRRKFADDHRDVPLKDLADLGGWPSPRTIIEVGQASDGEAVRGAQKRRKVGGHGEEGTLRTHTPSRTRGAYTPRTPPREGFPHGR